MDNFAKFLGNLFYKLAVGAFKEANYSTFRILLMEGSHTLNQYLIYNHNAKVIPANSNSIFTEDHYQRIIDRFEYYDGFQHTNFYNQSIIVT
jgi:hypothetical protein